MNVTYGVQCYGWGKLGNDSMVAKLKGASDPDFKVSDGERYAEMWIGTHPKSPSTVGDKSLSEVITKEGYGEDMPYLLKVLSIDKALSIQAHPTKPDAEVLHSKDPKNYPDPNHKPELIVAITEIYALACFREETDIERIVSQRPTLSSLSPSKSSLKSIMETLLGPEGLKLVAPHKAALQSVDASQLSTEDIWFLKLNTQFPDDSGALMVYILNLLNLKPGQGVYLKPNEPHAYLSGNGVEIMAKSDNVVRAGLTPKFKDAETLLRMMTYNPGALKEMALPFDDSCQVSKFNPPREISEFQLTMHRLGQSFDNKSTHQTHSTTIMLVVKGNVTFSSDKQSGSATTGSATLFPPGACISVEAAASTKPESVDLSADAVVFFAETNSLSKL
eukprot:TRINITY_DN2198_c3_g1_i1.p1 TRINITY_DN2198_c3_g1~~TRINITY_DN2198_c3_g1_i1.p1  ORF type:complete len:406 (+),score=66.38 TRINITY_DN2198_c3_g1_i1:49-1218(+)